MKKMKMPVKSKKVHDEVEKVHDENEKVLDWKWKVPVKNSTLSLDGKRFQEVD